MDGSTNLRCCKQKQCFYSVNFLISLVSGSAFADELQQHRCDVFVPISFNSDEFREEFHLALGRNFSRYFIRREYASS
jgi:hypothetical protein